MSAEPAAAVPAGAERRGADLLVTVCNPSFELLKAVTKHNKRSTSKSELESHWSIRRTTSRHVNEATVPVAQLWAALCEAGGMHLVGLGRAGAWTVYVAARRRGHSRLPGSPQACTCCPATH